MQPFACRHRRRAQGQLQRCGQGERPVDRVFGPGNGLVIEPVDNACAGEQSADVFLIAETHRCIAGVFRFGGMEGGAEMVRADAKEIGWAAHK